MARTRKPNGLGNIYKRDTGRYEWKQMIDGKMRYASSMDRAELEEKIKKIANLPITNNKCKVSEWFEKWLEHYIEPLKKPATYEQYATMWRKHIEPKLGYRLIKKVTRVDIQEVITEMNKKNLSTCTMKHTRKVMHIAFSKALEDKIISENPVYNIEIPKKQAKPRKTLNIEELKILFDSLKSTRWYWCFRFMLVTGLRRGEILALNFTDIDYKNKRIVVNKSNSLSGIGDTKSSEVHYVPLSDEAIFFIGKQKEMLEKEKNPVFYEYELKNAGLIFPSETGTLMKPASLNSVLDRINLKTNKHFTPHMMRHTFVFMSKGLVSLSELQEALGHDESTTTLDIYGTMLSDTETTAKKLDNAFKDLDKAMSEIKEKAKEKELAKVIQLNKFKKA